MIRVSMTSIFVALVLLSQNLHADVQTREEQLIYSLAAFNGMDYSRTFSRQGKDAIYLIADENNFLSTIHNRNNTGKSNIFFTIFSYIVNLTRKCFLFF